MSASYVSNAQLSPGRPGAPLHSPYQQVPSPVYTPNMPSPGLPSPPPRSSFRRSLPSPQHAGLPSPVGHPSPPAPPAQPIEEGDLVWVEDSTQVCLPALVIRVGFLYDAATDQEKQVTIVHTEEGEEREIRDRALLKLPQVHNPKHLPSLSIHDLSSLALMATNGDVGRNEFFSHAQLENIVLYTLRARYRMEQIYTWVDRVLVSINPVTPLPIYTPSQMMAHKSREQSPFFESETMNEAPPHVFAIAQSAIRCMQDAAEDQAVILLGSMGSGKSEAAKLIVQYLCEVGENTVRSEADSDPGLLHPIGQQILHAFTILEAFGNAATTQNRNSSRFAKMISVEFSKHGYVIGGGFTTHCFERSRVIECKDHERNFHIFYQVLAGVQHDPSLRDALELNKTYSDFELLKKADPDMVNPALDARDYRDLMSSFSALRIRKNQRLEIIRIIAALLHLGNVDFVPEVDGKNGHGDAPSCALKDPSQIVLAARLLEVEPVVLDNYFRTRQFFSKEGSKTVSSLKVVTVSQARKARDTFMRSLYESLFHFLVETLNGILGGIFDRYEKSNIAINSQGVHVLDIVGFENLDSSAANGFDQLCFNYWSEKVQSFYVQNTLAINFAELDDESEHIENRLTAHSNIELASDQDECLGLFESVPFGIFALLNDHSKVRSPNDEDLVSKILAGNEGMRCLYRPNLAKEPTNEYFTPSKEWRLLFVVQHYCGKVTYSGKGMSAKNTLTISSTCAAIMQSSKNAVLHAVGSAQVAAASNDKPNKQPSGGSKFRSSMASAKELKRTSSETSAAEVLTQADALLQALNRTGKNFLVCLKPNERLEEGSFDSQYVLDQIRHTHLVDLIKASRSIFTVHLTYNHFFRHYKSICGHRGTLESLLRSLSAIGVLEEDKYVVGKAKVYLTSHQWKKLEKARYLYLNACATMIQRNMLRGVFRKKSSRLLYLMKGLRIAMKNRDAEDIIQHIADCNRILGKRATSDIRILSEGKALITSLDEEAYVKSIFKDAQLINHPVLLEYATFVAKKCCPATRLEHLTSTRRRGSVAATRRMSENVTLINEKLRGSIIKHDAEALMGTLATLEEPSAESLERKLATMIIIRALEEKSAVEALTKAAASLGENESSAAVVARLQTPMVKVLTMGLERKFPELKPRFENVSDDSVNDMIPLVTPPTEVPKASVDTSLIVTALEKAYEEENVIAMKRILKRLQALGVEPSDLTKLVERKLDLELNSVSSLAERKQIVKYLSIAKISQDLELLSGAIDAAVATGLAKWDFNLKNAQKERDRLLETSTNTGSGANVTPPSGASAAGVKPPSSAAWMWRIWSETDVSKLAVMKEEVPKELQDIAEAKLKRIQVVGEIEAALQSALNASQSKTIEEAFQKAIGVGFCSPLFPQLFAAYQQLQPQASPGSADVSPPLTDGLTATMKFLAKRIEANADIREDALELLSSQIQAFSNETHEPSAKEKALTEAGKLRRSVEKCIAARARLESMLALSDETLSVGTLQLSLDAAKNAGVSEHLLVKAEEKILSARISLSMLDDSDAPGDSTTHEDGQLKRLTSDTTGWDDTPLDPTDDAAKLVLEKGAAAFNQFENLRGVNAQSESTLARKLCWEGRALSQSLSALDDLKACQLSLYINRCILGYMRDRIVFYREMLAQYILQIGVAKASLVDEIYLQLMKQLTKNPKRDSSIRGWSLFAMCASSFAPSAALERYVAMFLRAQIADSNSFWRLVRNFAAYSLKKMENLLAQGATGFIPSIEEIRGYEARPPFLATIELMDGTPLAEAFPVTPELTVEHLVEICSHFLGLDDRMSKFLGLSSVADKVDKSGDDGNNTSNDDAVRASSIQATDANGTSSSSSSYFHKFLSTSCFLSSEVYLGDIFERELIRGREVRFVLKIRLFPMFLLHEVHDEMYDRLTYIQVLDEIIRGNLPLLEEDSVVRLAAVAVAVDCIDDLPQDESEMLDMNVLEYVPPEWHKAHTEEEWAARIFEFVDSFLRSDGDQVLDGSDLQRVFVDEVARHRLYGAVFFPSKLLNRNRSATGGANGALGIELPSYFVIAVNGYGLHFVGRDGTILAFCEYGDITYCGGTYNQYKICLRKQGASGSGIQASAFSVATPNATTEELVLTTKYSDELTALIGDYKELTALGTDG
ncbi:TPA: hypothetical protein N0F65_007056 [Lagenidium giganteum]|uniref:Uncharacterized protein n=1 Tax=Lagenidium giganteum TaxID=4803 RepID=A0AAV2YRR3_9STRA|nr:TPA: hypothetical protein N0F65_007056 [Lagenidium giganteum]